MLITKRSKILFVLLALLFSLLSISLVHAQASGDWNISGDWNNNIGGPTATPTSPSQTTNILGMGLEALSLFAIVPIISISSLIIGLVMMQRSGQELDASAVVITIVLVISIDIILMVGVVIMNGVQNAMPSLLLSINL